ncbi:hypothetical protein BX591_12072 [Paraburkholderia bryophila]|uniref:Uncharacterized protein n=1 Tax=Paraburkholderia bryophila TaxID=420952 RepID=A0A329BLH3_9BURK|nr:hypothetical protein BX591_12072 [Paraburkholderia bryophila]
MFQNRPLNALCIALKSGRALSDERRATNSLAGGGLSAIPTHAELTESLGGLFTLTSPEGTAVQARLIDAPVGVPMDDDYVCYHAFFELPLGVQLPQDNYRVDAPDGRAWVLLATPVRPQKNGAATLCIVIHTLKPAAQQPVESSQ